jgi:hypothetical protein
MEFDRDTVKQISLREHLAYLPTNEVTETGLLIYESEVQPIQDEEFKNNNLGWTQTDDSEVTRPFPPGKGDDVYYQDLVLDEFFECEGIVDEQKDQVLKEPYHSEIDKIRIKDGNYRNNLSKSVFEELTARGIRRRRGADKPSNDKFIKKPLFGKYVLKQHIELNEEDMKVAHKLWKMVSTYTAVYGTRMYQDFRLGELANAFLNVTQFLYIRQYYNARTTSSTKAQEIMFDDGCRKLRALKWGYSLGYNDGVTRTYRRAISNVTEVWMRYYKWCLKRFIGISSDRVTRMLEKNKRIYAISNQDMTEEAQMQGKDGSGEKPDTAEGNAISAFFKKMKNNFKQTKIGKVGSVLSDDPEEVASVFEPIIEAAMGSFFDDLKKRAKNLVADCLQSIKDFYAYCKDRFNEFLETARSVLESVVEFEMTKKRQFLCGLALFLFLSATWRWYSDPVGNTILLLLLQSSLIFIGAVATSELITYVTTYYETGARMNFGSFLPGLGEALLACFTMYNVNTVTNLISRAPSVIDNVKGFFTWFIDKFYYILSGGKHWFPCYEQAEKLKTYIKSISKFLVMTNKEARICVSASMSMEVLRLGAQYPEMSSWMDSLGFDKGPTASTMKSFFSLYEVVKKHSIVTKARIEPVVVSLYNHHGGTGKSSTLTLMPKIIYDLVRAGLPTMYTEDYHPARIFMKGDDQMFYDGLDPETSFCMIQDEFCQRVDSVTRGQALSDFMSNVSPAPKVMTGASLANKNTIYAAYPLHFISTNVRDSELRAANCVSNIDSYFRRRHFHVEVTVNEKIEDEKERIDRRNDAWRYTIHYEKELDNEQNTLQKSLVDTGISYEMLKKEKKISLNIDQLCALVANTIIERVKSRNKMGDYLYGMNFAKINPYVLPHEEENESYDTDITMSDRLRRYIDSWINGSKKPEVKPGATLDIGRVSQDIEESVSRRKQLDAIAINEIKKALTEQYDLLTVHSLTLKYGSDMCCLVITKEFPGLFESYIRSQFAGSTSYLPAKLDLKEKVRMFKSDVNVLRYPYAKGTERKDIYKFLNEHYGSAFVNTYIKNLATMQNGSSEEDEFNELEEMCLRNLRIAKARADEVLSDTGAATSGWLDYAKGFFSYTKDKNVFTRFNEITMYGNPAEYSAFITKNYKVLFDKLRDSINVDNQEDQAILIDFFKRGINPDHRKRREFYRDCRDMVMSAWGFMLTSQEREEMTLVRMYQSQISLKDLDLLCKYKQLICGVANPKPYPYIRAEARYYMDLVDCYILASSDGDIQHFSTLKCKVKERKEIVMASEALLTVSNWWTYMKTSIYGFYFNYRTLVLTFFTAILSFFITYGLITAGAAIYYAANPAVEKIIELNSLQKGQHARLTELPKVSLNMLGAKKGSCVKIAEGEEALIEDFSGSHYQIMPPDEKASLQAQLTSSLDAQIAKISNAIRKVVFHFDGFSKEGWCLMSGRTIYANKHYLNGSGFNFNSLSIKNGDALLNQIHKDNITLTLDPTYRDLMCIQINDQSMNAMPSLERFLVKKNEYCDYLGKTEVARIHKIAISGMVSYRYAMGSALSKGKQEIQMLKVDGQPFEFRLSEHIAVSSLVGEDGDCGLPYYIVLPNGAIKLMGFHCATVGACSMFTPLYADDVPKEAAYVMQGGKTVYKQGAHIPSCVNVTSSSVSYDYDGRLVAMGSLDKKSFIPSKTNIEPSVFQGDGVKNSIKPITTAPALLRPTYVEEMETIVYPLKNAMAKIPAPPIRMFPRYVMDLMKYYPQIAFEGFLPRTRKKFKILTILEALSVLDMSTSVGVDMKKEGFSSRSELWDIEKSWVNPVLISAVNELLIAMKAGFEIKNVVEGCLKDETRDLERVRNGKTRLFCVGSLAHLVVTVMIMGDMVTYLKQHRAETDVCIGVNPHGREWWTYAVKLQSFKKFGGGDFSGYDTSIVHQFGYGLYLCMKWYSNWSDPLDLWMLYNVCVSSVAPLMVVGNQLYWLDWMNSSGGWLTGFLNSFVNSVIFNTFVWKIYQQQGISARTRNEHMRCMFYGDDNLWSVSETLSKFVTMKTLSTHIWDSFGMKYTTPAKEEITSEFLEFEELEFLCRKFVYVDHGLYKAPLSEDSINGMLLWVKKSKIATPRQQLAINVEQAMMEFFHYGRERFEKEEILLREYCEHFNVTYSGLSYDQYQERWSHGQLSAQ